MVNDRAVQFMSFDALVGLMEMMKEQERIVVPYHELCEDKLEELNLIFKQINVGTMIEVIYYEKNEYIKKIGLVSKIDLLDKSITVVTTKIYLGNIYDLKIINDNF